ncbi:MAG: hypothetical protein ACREOW_00285 [Thermodesulfobacteriota bacterium]
MGFSTETKQIIQALREIAELYSFSFKTEPRLFPKRGPNSERVDVVFSLPSRRPILWFEIDNQPDRAAHNRLKMFADVLSLIPVISVAVHHGRAAKRPHTYPTELLNAGFVLPRRFLDAVSVATDSYEVIVSELRSWIEGVFGHLATEPQWGTVFDIAEQYQPLIGNGSVQVAAAHLEAYSALGWFLVEKGRLGEERAACLTIALARMLQRAGYHEEAQRHIQQFRQRISDPSSLSASTNDDAKAVEFLLDQPDFADVSSLEHLSSALNSVSAGYHKSKFLWRKAIPHIISGHFDRAQYVIESYRELMSDSLMAQANVALLGTLASLLLHRGDPREFAAEYAKRERFLLEQKEGTPDGTVHGVITSLYLKVLAEEACGNKTATSILPQLDAFCKNAGVPRSVDGLREICVVLPKNEISFKLASGIGGIKLTEQLNRKRKDELDALCARVDLVFGR